jgi:hypothetical protein
MVYNKDLTLQKDWVQLIKELELRLGKRPKDINGVLFLIGVQELGAGNQNFSKEEKQDLMHIAICKVLSFGGFYELEGLDKEGWPHWKLIKALPRFDLLEQEKLLKMYVLEYFETELGFEINHA